MKDLLVKSLPVLAILFILGVALKELNDFGQARYDAGFPWRRPRAISHWRS